MRTHSTHFHSGASAKWRFLHGTWSFPPSGELVWSGNKLQPATRRLRLGVRSCLPNRKTVIQASKQTRSTSAPELVTRVHCHSRETTPMARAVPLARLGSSAAVFSSLAPLRGEMIDAAGATRWEELSALAPPAGRIAESPLYLSIIGNMSMFAAKKTRTNLLTWWTVVNFSFCFFWCLNGLNFHPFV